MAMVKIPYSIISFCLLFYMPVAWAADITASGGWYKSIDADDLTGGAGSNLRDPLESGVSATILNVTATVGWKVTAARTGGFKGGLSVKESGGGYVVIPESGANDFITKYSGNQSDIGCQYQLSGISINDAPGTLGETTVTYTVIE